MNDQSTGDLPRAVEMEILAPANQVRNRHRSNFSNERAGS